MLPSSDRYSCPSPSKTRSYASPTKACASQPRWIRRDGHREGDRCRAADLRRSDHARRGQQIASCDGDVQSPAFGGALGAVHV